MKTKTLHIIFFSLVIALAISFSCCSEKKLTPEVNPEIETGFLELIASYHLDVTEPSGLTFGPEKKTLLTVSDNTNQVYEIALNGELLRSWDYEGNDLEGVTYNPLNQTIAVCEERKRDVVIIDYVSGQLLDSYHIDIPIGSENSGLEGIAFNTNSRLYYLANESNPGSIILWTPADGIISKTDLQFAADYSGLFIENETARIWVVSDESKKLFCCDYQYKPLIEYALDASKYEGVAVDHANQIIYMVNDAAATLSIYQILN